MYAIIFVSSPPFSPSSHLSHLIFIICIYVCVFWCFSEDVLKIQQTSDLTSLKEIDKEFDVEKVLDTHSLDLPSLTEDLFRAVNLKEDLNILRGERLDDKLDIIVCGL